MQVALYFDWMELEPLIYPVGAIRFSASGMAFSCLKTLTVFGIRNLVTAIFFPNFLTVLKSRVRSDKMDATTAKVILASQHIKKALVVPK